MSLRNAYKQKLTAQVEEQRAKLGVLKAHAKRVMADSRIVGYEELARAEHSLGLFAAKLKKVAGASLHALAEVKGGMGKALDDLTVSTKRAAGHLSETAKRPAAAKARRTPVQRTTRRARKTARTAPKRRVGGRAGVPPKAR
jgi:hypothetical protein